MTHSQPQEVQTYINTSFCENQRGRATTCQQTAKIQHVSQDGPINSFQLHQLNSN